MVVERVELSTSKLTESEEDQVADPEGSAEEIELLYAGISAGDSPVRSITEIPATSDATLTETSTLERQEIPDVSEAPTSSIPSSPAPTDPVQSSAAPSTAAVHPAITLPTGPRIYFPGGEPPSEYNPATVDMRVNLPITLYRQGPGLNRLQRQELMNAGLQLQKIKVPFLEDSEIGIFRKKKVHSSKEFVLGIEEMSPADQKKYYEFLRTHGIKGREKRPGRIVKITRIAIGDYKGYWYPHFEVLRSDKEKYVFNEANFHDMNSKDFEELYHILRSMPIRNRDVQRALETVTRHLKTLVRFYRSHDLQMAIESHQLAVNCRSPRRSIPGIENIPCYTVVKEPYGVVYEDREKTKRFLWFVQIYRFSDGTLKIIRDHLKARIRLIDEHFLKAFGTQFLDKGMRPSAAPLAQTAIFKQALERIVDRLEFRKSLRRIEGFLGMGREQLRSRRP